MVAEGNAATISKIFSGAASACIQPTQSVLRHAKPLVQPLWLQGAPAMPASPTQTEPDLAMTNMTSDFF